MQGLVIGRYIFTDTSKRERGGALLFRVTAKQGHKIEFECVLVHLFSSIVLSCWKRLDKREMFI